MTQDDAQSDSPYRAEPEEEPLSSGTPRSRPGRRPRSHTEEPRAPERVLERVVVKAPPIEKVWYTKSEAAEYWGISMRTLQHWLSQGKIQVSRLPTGVPDREYSEIARGRDYRRVRIHIDDLRRVAEERSSGQREVGEVHLEAG